VTASNQASWPGRCRLNAVEWQNLLEHGWYYFYPMVSITDDRDHLDHGLDERLDSQHLRE
jgi:hypothetical protein